MPKGGEAHAKEFERISTATNTIREKIEQEKRRNHALDVLADHVKDFRERIADNELMNLKAHHSNATLDDKDWLAFKTRFDGDVDEIIKINKISATRTIAELEGTKGEEPTSDVNAPPPEISLLPAGADPGTLPLSILAKEEERLQRLIGADEDRRRSHVRLSDKIRATETQIKSLNEALALAEAAEGEVSKLVALRTSSYEGVFDGIIAEEKALQALYQPLGERLAGAEGSLGNLSFSIRRIVDLDEWARRGEQLIDTRRSSKFKGRGALLASAEAVLGEAWCSGTAQEVSVAMGTFRDEYNETIIQGAKADRNNKLEWRAWGAQVSEWLYSTEHIRVAYELRYEGVEIGTLSPGTRGIVLLLLYLAIDTEDDRPLIIDQPEENLDPKSIYDELVGLFRVVKQRRQIIIVTHNANLIVNTDADQVIVAECGPSKVGKLPDITYSSGSLEDPTIRKYVCDILEGGERAFQERAQRLRVSIG